MQNDTSLDPTIQIPLTQGYSTIVDEIDSDLLDFDWMFRKGYAVRTIKSNQKAQDVLIHRVILERMLKRPLESTELVDHIDNDGLNNSRSNLRLATKFQNGQNRLINKNNKSGYKGVSYYKSRHMWRASISINGKPKTLGYFATPLEAAQAYNDAALKHFGDFAKLNDLERPHIPDSSHSLTAKHFHQNGELGRKRRSSSNYKGVSWHKTKLKWVAFIGFNGKDVYLGTFIEEVDAARAYNVAALKYYGGRASLNQVPDEK